MCMRRSSTVQGCASNALGYTPRTIHKKPPKCVVETIAFFVCHHQRNPQIFCEEAVTWKRLTHPNILSLLGVTIDHFQLISDWMSGGDLPDYIKNHSDADRLGLVGAPPVVFDPFLLSSLAIRRRQGPPLPPLLQRRSWGPQGSTWLF